MAVGVFLRQDAEDGKVGLRRASNTCIRLEPSVMSPGVASINFDAVVETIDPTEELFDQVVQPSLPLVCEGRNVSVIAAGCSSSGKSRLMHGDDPASSVGMVERCLRAIFDLVHASVAQDASRLVYIEMQCMRVEEALGSQAAGLASSPVFQAVRTLNDALKLYEVHLAASRVPAAASHSALLCRVHTSIRDSVVVGTLALVDVTGATFIAVPGDESPKTDYFLHSRALTAWHSAHMSASFTPCLLLGLRTHASCQQQVIQALLYGCRVKDTANSMPAIASSDTMRTSPLSKILTFLAPSAPPASQCSPTSKRFLHKHLPKVISGSDRATAVDRCMPHGMARYPHNSAPTTSSEDDGDSDDGSAGTRRPRPSTTRLAHPTKRSLDEAVKALAAEKALTERCAVRISQLNDMIKFQRAAHEKMERDKVAADRRLAETEDKLRLVQGIADRLEADVASLKRHDGVVAKPADSNMNLLQFSSRLSKVIDETKQVVAMKDQYIAQLEGKVRDAAAVATQKELALQDETAARLDMSSQMEAATARVVELQAECAATRAMLADSVAEVALLKSTIQATTQSTTTWREETEAHHRRAIRALEEKVAAQTQLLHRFKSQCEAHDQTVDAEAKRWQAAIDALTTKLHDEHVSKQLQMEAANVKMAESEQAWSARLQVLEAQQAGLARDVATWQHECRAAVLAKEATLGHLGAARVEAAQLWEEVAALRTQIAKSEAEVDGIRQSLPVVSVKVDRSTQSSDLPSTDGSGATDAMIQAMIAEVEQARRREAHLTHVLSLANRHEHEANVRLSQVQVELQSRRKENIELVWALHKRDHSLRVLEQRHAFVTQCMTADPAKSAAPL